MSAGGVWADDVLMGFCMFVRMASSAPIDFASGNHYQVLGVSQDASEASWRFCRVGISRAEWAKSDSLWLKTSSRVPIDFERRYFIFPRLSNFFLCHGGLAGSGDGEG